MLEQEEILNFLKQNKKNFRENYRITKLGLFGSFLSGNNTENSDIDILIELEDGTQNIYELKSRLRQFIRDNLNRDVDLAREKYLKPYIKGKILKEVYYV
ncbi:hypothetical protein COU24_00875 [Candidatus Kuenenbacteria bacterium CG10_big_fil_rev_8_21_14_0_10_39_14]|uniref:Polymerase nucleotidyl transferase domain-containing protein n=2 Tax=Candidatus Kueneniibacteriota TaxID=1752740 RepID=A0A2H0D0F9_9BACT|nr:MAG: hypothetical protein COW86_03705 [Candidatus Kuenenbacteria bacterium CG22_combo_CG10-13_8_21_14_all_39_9]PIR81012.1 MAG: hypothetical protein COU24_00875 [Candidatus Kuenenbacteria bacterium CG10_big_fil_rev_8_21_14_0_10_39_14]